MKDRKKLSLVKYKIQKSDWSPPTHTRSPSPAHISSVVLTVYSVGVKLFLLSHIFQSDLHLYRQPFLLTKERPKTTLLLFSMFRNIGLVQKNWTNTEFPLPVRFLHQPSRPRRCPCLQRCPWCTPPNRIRPGSLSRSLSTPTKRKVFQSQAVS